MPFQGPMGGGQGGGMPMGAPQQAPAPAPAQGPGPAAGGGMMQGPGAGGGQQDPLAMLEELLAQGDVQGATALLTQLFTAQGHPNPESAARQEIEALMAPQVERQLFGGM